MKRLNTEFNDSSYGSLLANIKDNFEEDGVVNDKIAQMELFQLEKSW